MTSFLQLSKNECREALAFAATVSGRPIHLLEKDVWVVWALQVLFGGSFSEHLVFKGGTSLSKAYRVIRRFSEDVDITYDIRAIAGDLIGSAKDSLPSNPSQEKKWSKEIKHRLAKWVDQNVAPLVADAVSKQNLSAHVRAEDDRIFIEYEPAEIGTGYVKPVVMLEFGARSTGEPSEVLPIVCDAAEHLTGLTFPVAEPRVMRAERTFWEKATAIHVFCARGTFRGGNRFARHWHDIVSLDKAGLADKAIVDRDLAITVAQHKAVFFAEKDEQKNTIDYHKAVSGALRLVPEGKAFGVLSDDYKHMVDDGLLLDDAEPFEKLMEHCRSIQERANRGVKAQQ